jgi:GNAT superfamily N-acetyltransferase
MIVRQATVGDLEKIVPLFDAYRQFYRRPTDLELARRFLRDRFQHSESVIFLAEDDDGAAIGFTQLFPSFSSASAARIFILNDLFVSLDGRRKGAGAMLLAAAANFGREMGAVRLALSTEVTNLTAQALYEREGWKRNSDFYSYDLTL